MNTITLTLEFNQENLAKLQQLFVADDPIILVPPMVKPQVQDKKPEPAETPESVKTPEPEKKITKAEVREAALALSKSRKTQLLNIFKDFGGKKLSDFDDRPEIYPEMLKKIQEAANA